MFALRCLAWSGFGFGSGSVCLGQLCHCARCVLDLTLGCRVRVGARGSLLMAMSLSLLAMAMAMARAGVVSASAVVALRAAKRLWRNTKAMRG